MVERDKSKLIADCIKKYRTIMAEKLKHTKNYSRDIDKLTEARTKIEVAFDKAGDEMLKDYCKDNNLNIKGIKEIINPSR